MSIVVRIMVGASMIEILNCSRGETEIPSAFFKSTPLSVSVILPVIAL
jgi:hypothetical protein